MEREGVCINALCLMAEQQNNSQLTSVTQTLGSKFKKRKRASSDVHTEEGREDPCAQLGVELMSHTTFMLMGRAWVVEGWRVWFKPFCLGSFIHSFIHSLCIISENPRVGDIEGMTAPVCGEVPPTEGRS